MGKFSDEPFPVALPQRTALTGSEPAFGDYLHVIPWPGFPTYKLADNLDGVGVLGTDGNAQAWLDVSSASGYIGFGTLDAVEAGIIGIISANGRYYFYGNRDFEFLTQPYVGTDKIFHEGANKAAVSSTTYAAPTGGATVDSQARASLVQLAADLADLRTKLHSANLQA